MIRRVYERLKRLEGNWSGEGRGDYPTIDAFCYEEHLRIVAGDTYPMLFYEQSTVLLPSREPSHWEAGFIRPLEDGAIDISSAQDSGRVEVLRGRLLDADDRSGDPDAWKLELSSIVLQHDPRLVATSRVFMLDGDTLEYVVRMATRTTPQPRLQQHLSASLTRR